MSKSCDITLDDKYVVHISIIPPLGLIIINELEDFAESWLEIKVVKDSKYKLQFDVTPLTKTEDSEQAACRYFVDILLDKLHGMSGPALDHVGSLLKFMFNLRISSHILKNRSYITTIGKALGDLYSSSSEKSLGI